MTLSRQLAEDLFRKVLKYSRAEETEASFAGISYSLTRFANNTIHQNVSEEDLNISVRAVSGQRTARASTNKTDDDSIRAACDAALELALLQPSDPEMLPMAEPSAYRTVNRMDQETAQLSPQARTETVRRAIERAEKDRLTAAGVFSSGASAQAIFNSRGVAVFHEESVSEFSVTMLDGTSSGWAKKTGWHWRDLEIDALA